MAKKNYNVIILVAIIAVAVLLAPAAISSLGNAWNKGWSDFWKNFGESLSGGGTTGINLEITYTNGTKRLFNASETNSLVPLMLPADGGGGGGDETIKDISGFISTYVYTNIEPTSGQVSGTLKVMSSSGSIIKSFGQNSASTFLKTQTTNGDWQAYFENARCTITASEIEAAYQGKTGQQYIEWQGTVDVNMKFEGSSDASKTADTLASRFYFEMSSTVTQGAITSVHASVQISVVRLTPD